MPLNLIKWAACFVAVAIMPVASASAQVKTEEPPVTPGAAKVRIDTIRVASRGIAGNLLKTPAERDVIVVLPPSYDKQPRRRYPVVYALHGFSIGAAQWTQELHLPATAESAFAAGTPEMIIVFPDSKNVYGGAFYTRSIVTGNFEGFIADELPAFIDRHYRTIARREARGLVGHSMGGYGTARIGSLRPDRFGAIYMMSPCCLAPMGVQGLTAKEVAEIAVLKSPQDLVGKPFIYTGPLATGAAFTPNPLKPPLYVDLPVDGKGEILPDVMARRGANAPLAMLDQNVVNLRQYKAIAIDVGDKDSIVPTATQLHEALSNYGIANEFEVYAGTHTSKVAFRFKDYVLPFFGRALLTTPAK